MQEALKTPPLDKADDDPVAKILTRILMTILPEVDEAYPGKKQSGLTAVIALIIGKGLLAANVGDSRANLSYPDRAAELLTTEQTVDRVDEAERIKTAGATIQNGGVFGGIKMTRFYGDLDRNERPELTGPAFTAEPEITYKVIPENTLFMLMAVMD